MAQSAVHSYCNEWNSLFGKSSVISLEELRRTCVEGRLQGSRFRSICWRLLLHCLPCEKARWADAASQWRVKFDKLKCQYDIDPHRLEESASDLQHNNPLSLHSKNPWQQYFDDVELKGSIKQDVERTFPELEYFQSQSVREMMIEILFLYARENPHLAYKQGMHEILGPLIFVLFFDHETFEHASKEDDFEILESESRNLLSLLADQKFLEHDAYEMFTQIMLVIQPWYYFADEHQHRVVERENEDEKKSKRASSTEAYHRFLSEPFARIQDSGQSSVLVQKLNWIGDNLVRHSDPQLYNHLEKLEIPPQIYGIRWLRLLFGREFPIQDLLFLWDAIFADGPPFALVDYIFVAMLIFIRDLLLDCDYTGCLHYLMRYPPVTDVHRLLAVALHLQNPKKYPKPVLSSVQTNFSTITITGRPHPNMQRQAEAASNRMSNMAASADSTSLTTAVNKMAMSFQKLNKAGAAVVDGILEQSGPSLFEIPVVNTSGFKKPNHAHGQRLQQQQQQQQRQGPQQVSSFKVQRAPQQQKQNGSPVGGTGSSKGPTAKNMPVQQQGRVVSEEEMELLKEQISCLQVRLSDVEHTAHTVAEKLVGCADSLSDRLGILNVAPTDDVHQTLDYIRQLSRILKGNDSPRLLHSDTIRKSSTDSPVSISSDRMDGLNTPVEVGSDPVHEISPNTDRQLQQAKPGPGGSGEPSGNTGARQKVAMGVAKPRLCTENELKEIVRPK